MYFRVIFLLFLSSGVNLVKFQEDGDDPTCETKHWDNSSFNCFNYGEIPRLNDSVVKLAVYFCKISKLHNEELSNLTSLSDLWLPCKIKEIEPDAFKNAESLTTLGLSQNQLENLDLNVFQYLTNLQSLSLSFNPLGNFKKGSSFPLLPKLMNLNLVNCNLTLIEVNLFKNLQNLQELSLSNNKLATLDWRSFAPLKKFNSIRLSFNPFHCDCKLHALLEFFKKRNITLDNHYSIPKCASQPTELKRVYLVGKNITDVEPKDLICSPEWPSVKSFITVEGENIDEIDLNEKGIIKGVKVECRYGRFPPPEVTWLKDDKNLTDAMIITRNGEDEEDFTDESVQELVLINPTPADGGGYECRISNEAGKDSKYLYLGLGQKTITFYKEDDSDSKETEFLGEDYLTTECKNFADENLNQVVGVRSEACVALFSQENCSGEKVIIQKHSGWQRFKYLPENIKKNITAFRACEESEIKEELKIENLNDYRNIKLYKDKEKSEMIYSGKVKNGVCVTLDWLNFRQASAVDVWDCVDLFDSRNCEGEMVRVERGEEMDSGFDKKLVSYAPCS